MAGAKRTEVEQELAISLVAFAFEHCRLKADDRSDAAHMQLALWVVDEKAKNAKLREELSRHDAREIPEGM